MLNSMNSSSVEMVVKTTILKNMTTPSRLTLPFQLIDIQLIEITQFLCANCGNKETSFLCTEWMDVTKCTVSFNYFQLEVHFLKLNAFTLQMLCLCFALMEFSWSVWKCPVTPKEHLIFSLGPAMQKCHEMFQFKRRWGKREIINISSTTHIILFPISLFKQTFLMVFNFSFVNVDFIWPSSFPWVTTW